MKKRSQELPYWLSLFAALALLSLGAGMACAWIYALFVLLIAVFDWLSQRFAWSWCPTALFLAYVALAACALFIDFSPALTIAGVAAALFHWELSDPLGKDTCESDGPLAGLFQQHRLRNLGISTAIGLILTELGLLLRVDLPFLGAILAAMVLLFCLYRLFFTSSARRQRPGR